jgi:hypothetical protein
MRQLSDSFAAFSNISLLTSARAVRVAQKMENTMSAMMKNKAEECRDNTFMTSPLKKNRRRRRQRLAFYFGR